MDTSLLQLLSSPLLRTLTTKQLVRRSLRINQRETVELSILESRQWVLNSC